MRRAVWALVVAFVALGGDYAVGEPANEWSVVEQIKAAAVAYDAQDCSTVLKLAEPLIDPPGQSALPADLLTVAYEIVVSCERKDEAYEVAYAHALKATAIDSISDDMWRFRLAYELDEKRDSGAVETLEGMSNGRGAAVNAIPIRWMGQLYRRIDKPESVALKRRFLEVVLTTEYTPNEPFASTDGFAIDYARMLHGDGNATRAAALVRKITNPSILIQASFDPRLRSYVPETIDVRALFERKLAGDRAVAVAHPELLEAYTAQAEDLRRLGRPAEALAVLDLAQTKIGDANVFSDIDAHLNWFWDSRGRTFHMLNRYEESVASFQKGAALNEMGYPNVSQVINLAELQISFGRGADALSTLSPFAGQERKSSAYGEMEMRFARVCAFAISGRGQEAAADLDYMKQHETDHPEALGDVLLCFDDFDGAAAAFIRRLDDPDRRAKALEQLSDYDAPPITLPSDPVTARLPKLKKRADVQAAIARAGGLRRFNVQPAAL
mgnify:CR=1 FL=1